MDGCDLYYRGGGCWEGGGEGGWRIRRLNVEKRKSDLRKIIKVKQIRKQKNAVFF